MFEGAAASVCYTARYPVCAPTSIDSFGKRESLSTIGLVSLCREVRRLRSRTFVSFVMRF